MADSAAIIKAIRSDLRNREDTAHREGLVRFFKEQINPLGVRSRELSAVVSRSWRLARALPPTELIGLCDMLWDSGVFEEGSLACKLCARALPALDAPAFIHFERWLHTRVGNWAHCDDLCSHCIGGLLPAYPDLLERTLPWLASTNRWVRRGAAVCCVKPAHHGLYLSHAFHVADALIDDTDDMVRKGCGWLLKEASRAWPREVLEFVILRSGRMPRVTLRTAIELLPPEWRQKAMCTRTPDPFPC
jgi:3-methyladenine DNA glycosylase AlkD